jgi:colanic acid/amylovoran biosynthesis glycosyltransferase
MKILYYSRNYGAVTTTFIRGEVNYFRTVAECRYLCQEAGSSYGNDSMVTVIPFRESRIMKKIRWLLWKRDIACWFHNPRYAAQVKKLVDDFQPDVIHCHFGYEALQLLDNIDFKKYPVIVHFHGYDASEMVRKKSYIRRLQRLFSNPGVYPVSCNDFFVKVLTGKLRTQEKKFKVLRYGIDLDLFNPGIQSSGAVEKSFLQVSSLAEKKGHEFTLRAFSILVRKNKEHTYRLIFTGDGERKKELESLAEELGIRSRVTFAGVVTSAQAAQMMASADVFVHHSIVSPKGDMEGIPNSIIEAMAMEMAIVSTWHSGIPELVEHGVNGFLVKEKDVEDYAEKMELALKMGRLPRNREKIRLHYNLATHNQQLNDLYHEVIR